MPRARRCLTALLAACSCVVAVRSSRADVSDFIRSCIANIDDLSRLGTGLAPSGMAEIDPADGPRIFFDMAPPERQRVWASVRPTGVKAEAYTGYFLGESTAPLELCWHVSVRGENPVAALRMLKERYPVIDGTLRTGTSFFYGGDERWTARIGGVDTLIGVSWPLKGVPTEGASTLYVARARSGRAP